VVGPGCNQSSGADGGAACDACSLCRPIAIRHFCGFGNDQTTGNFHTFFLWQMTVDFNKNQPPIAV
jgi:hypothetical protein